MKRCGLYIRVSSDDQAKIVEGSLKNQDQLLTQHIDIKNKISNDKWMIVDRYVDRGRSAKDTKGRPEYLRMIQDVERGRIDTIVCTALSRISRSTRDLLDMVDYFKKNNIDFICLKEDFDTTTAQGKCFITIMGALNEFEREQTSERTRSHMAARAARGLWNGGHILGYDLQPDKKGYLLPNAKEQVIVNYCFDTYLDCGSVLKACEIVNAKGYRTKEYTTQEDKLHASKKFTYTTMLKLLSNLSYMGKKEVNKYLMHKPQDTLSEDKRYKIVNSVWEAIVDKDKFDKVQNLLRENLQHKYNGAKPSKHFYLFNGGILRCHKCGTSMEGRSAHGYDGKKVYYYYVCNNSQCRFKLPEIELESALRQAIKTVILDEVMLNKIVDKVNQKLKHELPRLTTQKKACQKELEDLTAKASCIMEKYMGIKEGDEFIKENLAKLAGRKKQIQEQIETIDILLRDNEGQAVDKDFISGTLESFDEIYREDIKPYQRRELLYAILTKIDLSDKLIKVGVPLERYGDTSLNHPGEMLSSKSLGGVLIF